MRAKSPTETERNISIDELTIGMYVTALDKSWFRTPFFSHQRFIRQSKDIALLREYGIRIVTIDTHRGKDVIEPAAPRETDPTERVPTKLVPEPGLWQEADHTAEHSQALSYDAVCAVRAEATVAVQKIFEGVKNGIPIHGAETKRVVEKLFLNIVDSPNHLLHLVHMRHYDANLYAHAVDVCSLALIIGKRFGFDDTTLERLGVGALLHDVGQMRVPRNVLRKPGRLGPGERKLVEMHPALGVITVSQAGDIHADSIHIIAEHHERCDGSGYPKRRKAPDISAMSQIVAISDVYDDMLSGRWARIPLQPAQAVRELYRAGAAKQFDMKLIHAAVSFLGIYPVGSLVELTTGEQAVVVEINPGESLRPFVKLIRDEKGRPYRTARVVRLGADENGGEERAIRCLLDQYG